MNEIAQDRFDYGQLDGGTRQLVQNAADEIRRLGKQTVESIVEIGRQLTVVRDRLPHGQWGIWLACEFAWSETTARRFMDSYSLIKSAKLEDLPRLLELPPSAVAEIATPSTPEPARQEVLGKVKAGEKVTTKAVKETVQRHKKPAARKPKPIDGDREPKPKAGTGRPDLVVKLRELDLALPDDFDPAPWIADMPDWRQREIRQLVGDLHLKVYTLHKRISGNPEPSLVDAVARVQERQVEPEQADLEEAIAEAAPDLRIMSGKDLVALCEAAGCSFKGFAQRCGLKGGQIRSFRAAKKVDFGGDPLAYNYVQQLRARAAARAAGNDPDAAAISASRSSSTEAPAPDDLRDRVRAALTKLEMSETRFAKHADMSQGTLNRFMLGIGKVNASNRAKIETALAELADYAEHNANAAPVETGAALA